MNTLTEVNPTALNEEVEPRHRLVIDMPKRVYEKLQKVRRESGARTNAEVIRNSIRAYTWLLKQVAAGYTIRLIKDGVVVKDVDIELVA